MDTVNIVPWIIEGEQILIFFLVCAIIAAVISVINSESLQYIIKIGGK